MDRKEARRKAQELVMKMTIEEKASQLRYDSPGISRLGIPEYNWWNEGLHGVARAGIATVFPQAIGMAASFDEDMVRKIGDIIAEEGRAKYNAASKQDDRDIYKGLTFWAPNVNIFRDPRWGSKNQKGTIMQNNPVTQPEKKNISKPHLYFWLFSINLFISAFTFGGGYVVVPMIRKYFVEQKKLFDEDELMNMAAVAQSVPGAIAINLSALAGYRCAGTAGVLISCLASILPPIVILSFISSWYTYFAANAVIAAVLKGMQAGAAALIVDLVIDMTNMIIKERSPFLTLMIPASFAAGFIFHINVAVILGICCILCVFRLLAKEHLTSRQAAGKADL